MNQSEQIAELAAALAKAQGAMDHASKDRTNPAFKSRYADLASVVDACRPALSQHGIAVLQPARVVELRVEVDTMLVHQSGQWVCETLAASVKDQAAQTVGSAITYLRRYGLSSMVGVAPDDDDGNSSGRPERREAAPPRQAVEPAPVRQHDPDKLAGVNAWAEAKAKLDKGTSTFPDDGPAFSAAYHGAATPAEAITHMGRIWARLHASAKPAVKPQLPQRDTSQAALATRITQIVALLEHDGHAAAAKAARETISEYGAELGVAGIANADLPGCLSEVEAIANTALAPEVAA